jgi:hypothetical protein
VSLLLAIVKLKPTGRGGRIDMTGEYLEDVVGIREGDIQEGLATI